MGDFLATARWYEWVGFEARLLPPGFEILRHDDVKIFLQQADGYTKPDDPAARQRDAWNVHIDTENVQALFKELSSQREVIIGRGLTRQDYRQIEIDIVGPTDTCWCSRNR
jgi:hypothetical protein